MPVGIITSSIASKPVNRTADTRRSTVEDMRIDHRRLDDAMTQKILDRANIAAAFEQVSGDCACGVWVDITVPVQCRSPWPRATRNKVRDDTGQFGFRAPSGRDSAIPCTKSFCLIPGGDATRPRSEAIGSPDTSHS